MAMMSFPGGGGASVSARGVPAARFFVLTLLFALDARAVGAITPSTRQAAISRRTLLRDHDHSRAKRDAFGLPASARKRARASKRSEGGRDYLSLKLDDPSFNAPIFANLTQDEDGENYSLIWSRRSAD